VILYLDTSALAKLFIVEPGAESVSRAVVQAAAVATNLIAYAEMRATFSRAVQMSRVDTAALRALTVEFERRWASLDVLGVTEPLVRRAGDLAEWHGLRGYDCVHLAAVLALRESVGSAAEVRFGVFDAKLRDAALVHGLSLLSSA
jgi:predicted nucleic acid-binding protein